MQKGSFTAETPRRDTVGVAKRINHLADIFRSIGHAVIYIKHDRTGTGRFEKNSEDWENLNELLVFPTNIRIDK